MQTDQQKKSKKSYLGDAVYADMTSDGMILLTTEDGTGVASNEVYIEGTVFDALVEYATRNALPFSREVRDRLEAVASS